MSQPFIGEIRMFGGNFAPQSWAFCSGQLLPIAQYDALFNLIGTTYGGDGQSTFALPDLRGRVPMHQGTGFVIGQLAGLETITLNTNQLPIHTHQVKGSTSGGSDIPTGNTWGNSPTGKPYVASPGTVTMNPQSITVVGGNQPHDNMNPFLAITYIISLFGIYPSPN